MYVDDRQDPEKSTRAAARHLKDLYNQFGDWYLAMAAYNSGPGTVQAAVKRTGYADFWELYRRNVLPKETRNYVPIILAVTIMAKNPAQYGLSDLTSEDQPILLRHGEHRLSRGLASGSRLRRSHASELQDLNPSLLRLTTPRDGKFELHVPAGSKDQYQSRLPPFPRRIACGGASHRSPGETLASLARTYRTTVNRLPRSTTSTPDGALEAEAKLVIPLVSRQASGRRHAAYAAASRATKFTRETP